MELFSIAPTYARLKRIHMEVGGIALATLYDLSCGSERSQALARAGTAGLPLLPSLG